MNECEERMVRVLDALTEALEKAEAKGASTDDVVPCLLDLAAERARSDGLDRESFLAFCGACWDELVADEASGGPPWAN